MDGVGNSMNKTEQQLINQIQSCVQKRNSTIVKSIGDDCAVLDYNNDLYELFCTDVLVQDIHFDLDKISMKDVGYKAIAVNISDIAAMGGYPQAAVVSLVIPDKFQSKDIEVLYQGMEQCASVFDCSIVGGDISKGKNDFVINVAMTGKVEKDLVLYRSGAKYGDAVVVTGELGGSLLKKHYSFVPCIKEARWIAQNKLANAMIDISDGISKDLGEILASSNVKGAVLENIPMSKDCKNIDSALSDGEDYELLFTVPKENLEQLKAAQFKHTIIGQINNEVDGIYLKDKQGELQRVENKAYNHFNKKK